MAIKVGFSSSVCPEWDIHDIATKANEYGFYGVELGTVRDEIHLRQLLQAPLHCHRCFLRPWWARLAPHKRQ